MDGVNPATPMRFIQRWLVCVFVLVLAVSGLPLQAAKKAAATPPAAAGKAPVRGYEALVAEAMGFAAEKSWGMARDSYAAALAVGRRN